MSRYDNLDDKEILIQFRVKESLKKKFETWCKLQDVDGGMSGAFRSFMRSALYNEEFESFTAVASTPKKITWAIERWFPNIKFQKRRNGDNGNGKKYGFFS